MANERRTITRLNKRVVELEDYARDLRDRHDKAITTLASLAEGRGMKDNDHEEKKPGWDTCMRKLASSRLAEIALMQLRKVYL